MIYMAEVKLLENQKFIGLFDKNGALERVSANSSESKYPFLQDGIKKFKLLCHMTSMTST